MTEASRLLQGKHVHSVLIVEDDFLVRSVAVAHLQERGFSIVEAQTADEALLKIGADQSIAAVFSDVQLPGHMDGIALARLLARMCPKILARMCPKIKVLLTSGTIVPDKLIDWRFLAKPYSLEEMEWELRPSSPLVRKARAACRTIPALIDGVLEGVYGRWGARPAALKFSQLQFLGDCPKTNITPCME